MADISHWFDTSNFDKEHPLFSEANKRVLGKFKSETGDILPTEFCGLRSKMYSLATPDPSKSFLKAKRVPKAYVKKHVRHEQYLHVLNSWSVTKRKFRSFRSNRHEVTTREFTCPASTTSDISCRTAFVRWRTDTAVFQNEHFP